MEALEAYFYAPAIEFIVRVRCSSVRFETVRAYDFSRKIFEDFLCFCTIFEDESYSDRT